jgi:lysosomal Pro-X carboxypeptidase
MLKYWIRDAFDEMSMGNYPYPSTYISGAPYELPAYPIRKACASLKADIADPIDLFSGVASAAGLLYNVSKNLKCFDLPSYPTPTTPGK